MVRESRHRGLVKVNCDYWCGFVLWRIRDMKASPLNEYVFGDFYC